MQNQAAQQVVEALKKANNVMVTVKSSPSVDELTAAVGLTLMLNHMNKHSITVFSGQIPSMIEFLQPEMAIESNTDSLRDFIIALDKSKADKLRYKVEDNVVRIFITPYKTSISQQDLEFSQGDFNVDVVIALGVVSKDDFDQAVVSHGRILHDATVIGVTSQDVASQVGAVNWHDPQASSVSEMIASITDALGPNVLDGQIATSLMTGMVAETDRFRNAKTTPRALTLSAKLMTAGANQQLIATKLEEGTLLSAPSVVDSSTDSHAHKDDDGMLEIGHEGSDTVQGIHIDDQGNMEMPLAQSSDDLPDSLLSQEPSHEPVPLENNIPEPEALTRGYMKNESPVPSSGLSSVNPEDASLTNSLFDGQNNHKDDTQTDVSASINTDDKTLEHGHKVIQPLGEKDDETGPSAQNSTPPLDLEFQSQDSVLPPSPQAKQVQLPTDGNQTLTELEESVGRNDTSTNIDDYMGGTKNTNTSKSSKLDLPPPPKPAAPGSKTVAPASQLVKDNEIAAKTAPPPEVINSASAPAVPPPLMPPGASEPQFFEADGSKSNPFLDSSDK